MGVTQITLFDTWTETTAQPPIEPPAPVVLDAEYYRAHSHEYAWGGYGPDEWGRMYTEAEARAAFQRRYGYAPDVVLVSSETPRLLLVGPLRGRG